MAVVIGTAANSPMEPTSMAMIGSGNGFGVEGLPWSEVSQAQHQQGGQRGANVGHHQGVDGGGGVILADPQRAAVHAPEREAGVGAAQSHDGAGWPARR